MNSRTRRVALSGLLVAIMLILGFVESRLPIASFLKVSIPGIKLGLSNSVLVFALYALGIPNAFLLMLLKVVLSGLLFGGVSAMLYAFAGGLVSLIVMSVLRKMQGVHVVVVSMAGGAAHNAGQVALAMCIMETDALLYYMAVLMVIGLASGALTGICASRVMKSLGKNHLV